MSNARPTAVITGATSGIGRAIVDKLAVDHHVFALGRNPEALKELASLDHVDAVEADLSNFSGPGIEQVKGLDAVDVLVHAAAVARSLSVEQASREDWLEQLTLNLVAPAELSKILLPALKKARGVVVFINSGAGDGAYPGNVVYAATKHGLNALAKGFRKEVAGDGVRVTSVAPGPVDTPMLEGLMQQQGKPYEQQYYIEPHEVASAVRFAVDAGSSAQITDVAVRPRIELADRS